MKLFTSAGTRVYDLVIPYLGNWLRRFERPCETIQLFIFVRNDELLFRITIHETRNAV